MSKKTFTQSQLEAIANALGHTQDGLTGSEIQHILMSSKMVDVSPEMTKWKRLCNAFITSQNSKQDGICIIAFIRKAMKPERFIKEPERFEPMRANLNTALAFVGLCVDDTGALKAVINVATLTEAQERADSLRTDLIKRGVHPDVLKFCKAELLADDYFHAVLEAVKSVADKLRSKTGLSDDGSVLVDRALSGDRPILCINPFKSSSHKSEQKGFANLIRGIFSMFRNPTAHEARIHWSMSKDDAEDLLSMASLMHRRLDVATVPPRE